MDRDGTQPVVLRLVPPAGSDGLYYLHTDHLGSLTFMTLPSGTLHSDGTARYQPFGAFQQVPPPTLASPATATPTTSITTPATATSASST